MESDINGLDKLPEKSLKDGGQDKTCSIFRHQLRTINKWKWVWPHFLRSQGCDKEIKPMKHNRRVNYQNLMYTKPIEIIAENFPNLDKKINIYIEEVFRTPNSYDHRRTSSCCIMVKTIDV